MTEAEKMERYAVKLVMLKGLLQEKLITEAEFRAVKTAMQKDYKIQRFA